LAVRLFVGNLSYTTTEADLRAYFGTVAPPSHVVLPVDRETGRPRGFAFVEFLDRAQAEQAIQKFHGQLFNGRPLSVSEAARNRNANFGPDAKPQRGGNPKAKKKDDQKPRGPIPVKSGSRSYSLDDDSPEEPLTDFDDFATSRPEDEKEDEDA